MSTTRTLKPNIHKYLQHGEQSTSVCAPSVCRRLDVSAAPPHTGQNLYEQQGGGRFGLQCLVHPDSLMFHTVNGGPRGVRNMPVTTEHMFMEKNNVVIIKRITSSPVF